MNRQHRGWAGGHPADHRHPAQGIPAPFRSLVSIVPGTPDDLLDRMCDAFAAVDGDVEPIAPDTLADLVATVLAGRIVLVLGTRTVLRDAAKAQLMASGIAAALGMVRSA